MSPEIQKIKTIIDSFESIGIKAEDIYNEIDNLKSKESIYSRYRYVLLNIKKHDIREVNDYYTVRNPENLNNRNFHFFIEDYTIVEELQKIFGEELLIIKSNCFAINFSETDNFFKKIERIINKLSFRYEYYKNLKWTESNIDIAIKFDIINWKSISAGNYIDWTFDFVEKYKYCLDWNRIKSNKILDWNEFTIIKYSEFLFRNSILEPGENKYYLENLPNVKWTEKILDLYAEFINFEKLFNRHRFKLSENFINKHHQRLNIRNIIFYDNVKMYTDSFIRKYHTDIPFFKLSEFLDSNLSLDIYKEFRDKFDFDILCKNKRIELSIEFIDEFKDILNWEYVILFKHITWNIDLISKFQEYIFKPITPLNRKYNYSNPLFQFRQELNHSGYFESNLNVEWSETLIDKFIDKWNWKYLYINKISRDIISNNPKYKDYIQSEFIVEFSDDIIEIENYSDIENFFNYIGQNYNIIWTPNLFDKYIKNSKVVSLDLFCENAKIDNETIIQNQEYWNKLIEKQEHYRRNSDGSYFDINYDYLWEYLFINKNLEWNDHLIINCIENIKFHLLYRIRNLKLNVDTINKYFDYSKEEKVFSRGNYDSGCISENQLFIFKDVINRNFNELLITDLTFEKFQVYELKWFGSSLIAYDFNSVKLNKSISDVLKKEFNIE